MRDAERYELEAQSTVRDAERWRKIAPHLRVVSEPLSAHHGQYPQMRHRLALDPCEAWLPPDSDPPTVVWMIDSVPNDGFGMDVQAAPSPSPREQITEAESARVDAAQPFGFTHEDVAMLREAHAARLAREREMGVAYGNPRWVSLIARIEALLPPSP